MFDYEIIASKEHPMPDDIFKNLMSLNSKNILNFPFTTFCEDKIIRKENYMGVVDEHVFSKENLVVGVSIEKKENIFTLGIGTGCLIIDCIDITDENKEPLNSFYSKIKQLSKTMPQNYL